MNLAIADLVTARPPVMGTAQGQFRLKRGVRGGLRSGLLANYDRKNARSVGKGLVDTQAEPIKWHGKHFSGGHDSRLVRTSVKPLETLAEDFVESSR